MDVNDLRSIATLLMFVAFVGIVAWAWGAKRRAAFDDAAQLPFMDDLPAAGARGESK
ncbi:MAG: cbb3-type cytochrome c oxidase subunit 3 [Burkholderiaceae bacterium]|nr:cbb3-type cytochrome c oxidase subunit 3 [Burkholderiaceae bacterium]